MSHRYVVERSLKSRAWLEDEEIMDDIDNPILETLMEDASFFRFISHILGLCFLKTYEIVLTQPFYGLFITLHNYPVF